MDLIKINVVCPQAAQGGIDGIHDMFARQPALIGLVPHREENLGGDDHFVAFGKVAQSAASDFFTLADGVHIGGIEKGDAELEGAFDDRTALFFIQYPVAPLR